jgi:hypothetical protein
MSDWRLSCAVLVRVTFRGGGESDASGFGGARETGMFGCERDERVDVRTSGWVLEDTDEVRDFVRRGGGGKLISIGGDGGSGASDAQYISRGDVE